MYIALLAAACYPACSAEPPFKVIGITQSPGPGLPPVVTFAEQLPLPKAVPVKAAPAVVVVRVQTLGERILERRIARLSDRYTRVREARSRGVFPRVLRWYR